MKTLLKLLIAALVSVATVSESKAQSGPVECKIAYSYDAAGQRVKREYACAATWTPNDPLPWQDNSVFTSLFPNPTSGVFTGIFSAPVSSASFLISAMSGATVWQQTINQQMSSMTFDITAQVPGSYLLTVWAMDKVETYTIIKM